MPGTIFTRDSQLGFSHGNVRIELTVSGGKLSSDHDERFDAIMRTAVNIINIELIPAVNTYVRENIPLAESMIGQDTFIEAIVAEVKGVRVDLTIEVDLSVDLPDEAIEAMIHELVADDCLRSMQVAMTSDFSVLSWIGSVMDIVSGTTNIVSSLGQIPDFVSELFGTNGDSPKPPTKPEPFEAGPVGSTD